MAFASSSTVARRVSKRSDAIPIVIASRNAMSASSEPTSMSVGPSCSPGIRACHHRPIRNPTS